MRRRGYWGKLLRVTGIAAIVVLLYFHFTKGNEVANQFSTIEHIDELNLTLKTLDGQTVQLADIEHDKIVINFWATWCGPCLKELPLLNEAFYDVRNQSFFVMISDEPVRKIETFTNANPYPFLFLQAEEPIIDLVGSIPTTLVLDRDKCVIHYKLGAFDRAGIDELKQIIVGK